MEPGTIYLATARPKGGIFVRGQFKVKENSYKELIDGSIEFSLTDGRTWEKSEGERYLSQFLKEYRNKEISIISTRE